MKNVCIMSLGNVLTGDDALGPYVMAELESNYAFPDGVTLFDVGTPGIDLTMWLTDVDALIVIDAINATGPAGALRSYRRDELVRGGVPVKMSPHEPTLKEALLRLDFVGGGPREVLLIGAIPKTVETGAPISAPVLAAVPEIIETILVECERLGVAARSRLLSAPAPWLWSRPAELR